MAHPLLFRFVLKLVLKRTGVKLPPQVKIQKDWFDALIK